MYVFLKIEGKTLNRKKVAEISEGPLKNVRNYCFSTFQHNKVKSVGTVLKHIITEIEITSEI